MQTIQLRPDSHKTRLIGKKNATSHVEFRQQGNRVTRLEGNRVIR